MGVVQYLTFEEFKTCLKEPVSPGKKRINPEKRCFLQYDKLFIDGKVFIFSEASGSVEQQQNILTRGESADVYGSQR